MSHPPLRALVLFLAVVVLGGSALDAVLNLDDSFQGEICDPADVDVVEFDGFATTVTRFRVTATGSITLHPRVQLIDRTTDQVLADVAATGIQADTLQVMLPSSGKYELRISSADGTVGTYLLQTKGRTPVEILNSFTTHTVASGGTLEQSFDALNGYRMWATIQTAPSSQALPANPVLIGPFGPVSLTGFVYLQPHQIVIRMLPLGITSIQSFTLHADNIGGAGDLITHLLLEDILPPVNVVESDVCR